MAVGANVVIGAVFILRTAVLLYATVFPKGIPPDLIGEMVYSTLFVSLLLLWGEAVMVLTISPSEYYVGMRWQEVVTYGVRQPDVACPLVAYAAEIYTVGLALGR
jgi:hypothetical protein